MSETNWPVLNYQAMIKTSAEQVWQAIVDGDQTVLYFFSTRVSSTWEVGAPITYTLPDGTLAADGTILAIDAGRRVEFTFQARWDPDLAKDGAAREVWIVNPADEFTELKVEIYDLAPGSKTVADFTEGFSGLISGMKAMLEADSSANLTEKA
jgi:uncharacterized protein YndB with AHSA1/START domain